MLNQIFREWKLNRNSFLILLLSLPFCFLIGVGLLMLIMFLDEEVMTYFNMGTIMSIFSLVIIIIVCGISYRHEFSLALSMGQTRKDFMTAYAVRNLVYLTVAYVEILLLYHLELAAYSVIFPRIENEIVFSFLTDWRVILPAIVALLILNMFIGSVYSRFGKTGGIVLYILWTGSCLALPRVLHDGSPVAAFVLSVPVAAWISIGVAVLAGMLIFTIYQGRKQMVH